MQEARASTGLRLGAMAHELIASLDEREQLLSRLSSFGLATIQLGTPLLEEILTNEERIVAWSAQLQAAGRATISLGGYRNLVASVWSAISEPEGKMREQSENRFSSSGSSLMVAFRSLRKATLKNIFSQTCRILL